MERDENRARTYKQIEDKNGQATVLSNIGSVLASKGEKQEAIKTFNKAIDLSSTVQEA